MTTAGDQLPSAARCEVEAHAAVASSGPISNVGTSAGPSRPLSAADFDRLVEASGPASLLLVISGWMSPALAARVAPEDILQEALMHAWRDRDQVALDGTPRGFRLWLLAIVKNRIHDAADRELALKRGGGAVRVPLAGDGALPSSAPAWTAMLTTTPSRVAMLREQSAAMQAVLQSLPDDCREIVRLRLFEQQPIDSIAAAMGIGSSAVRHRFRRGVEIYQRRLVAQMGTRAGGGGGGGGGETASGGGGDAAGFHPERPRPAHDEPFSS